MANLYITEYNSIAFGIPGFPAPIALEPAVTSQNVSFTTATDSAAFNALTRIVRFVPSDNCHVEFGIDPDDATANSPIHYAGVEYWRGVPEGQSFKLSVYDGSS